MIVYESTFALDKVDRTVWIKNGHISIHLANFDVYDLTVRFNHLNKSPFVNEEISISIN